MNIVQSEDSPHRLATRFTDQLDRQLLLLRAFDLRKLPCSSLYTGTKYLLDLVLETVRDQTVSCPHSFSVFGWSILQPWFSGQSCVCLVIGGRDAHYEGSWSQRLANTLRALPAHVESEGVSLEDKRAYLLAYYDHTSDTLHLSAPMIAVFLPYHTNLAQEDGGAWVFAGVRESVNGTWVVDGVAQESGRDLQGREEIDEYFGGLFSIHLERLSDETIRRLRLVKALAKRGNDLFWTILMRAHSAGELEHFLENARREYGKTHRLW